MLFFVYIIYSQKIDKYYTGYSTNPDKRLEYHIKGRSGSKNAFTKRAGDWKLVYKKAFSTKIEALQVERFIKTRKSKKYIEDLIRIGSSMVEQPALNR